MTPGIKTSEGRIALLKVLVTSAIAVCTAFGVAVPAWLQPDAPWVTVAALVVGGVVTVVYTRQRTNLKRTVALHTPTVTAPVASVAPLPPPAAPTQP